MLKAVLKPVFICFFAVLIVSCSGADTRYGRSSAVIQNLINTPREFVDDDSQMLWEGEIGGKWVTYFRTVDTSGVKNVVIVTRDQLPTSYRSMEYCDNDGDNNLDRVNIRMFKQGQGWSDVIINNSNTSTLNHANVQYKRLMGNINYKRRSYLSVK